MVRGSWKPAAAGLAVLALVAGGCGSSSSGNDKPTLKVSAAASLKTAFAAYADHVADATPAYSFAGSDELAAQIRQGAAPDVFAAANSKLPDALYAEKKVEKPVAFARNRLVLAVPSASDIASLSDIEKPGTSLAIGSASVPIGDYTRKVLGRLPAAQRAAILANVKSSEPDVAGIVGKLTQGAVDAGFVYITDVKATKASCARSSWPRRSSLRSSTRPRS